MARRQVSDTEILAQIPAARRRALPIAIHVHYARSRRCLELTLDNGAALVIPIALIRSLRAASDLELARVALTPSGLGIQWAHLDQDLSIEGLAELVLGRRRLLRASGAAGGAARSAAKSKAARLNGLKGGRPARRVRAS